MDFIDLRSQWEMSIAYNNYFRNKNINDWDKSKMPCPVNFHLELLYTFSFKPCFVLILDDWVQLQGVSYACKSLYFGKNKPYDLRDSIRFPLS